MLTSNYALPSAQCIVDLRFLNLRFWIDPACCVLLSAFEEPQVPRRAGGPALPLVLTVYRVLPCR
jgi:hypothetical protein